jgi:hypothetical protein
VHPANPPTTIASLSRASACPRLANEGIRAGRLGTFHPIPLHPTPHHPPRHRLPSGIFRYTTHLLLPTRSFPAAEPPILHAHGPWMDVARAGPSGGLGKSDGESWQSSGMTSGGKSGKGEGCGIRGHSGERMQIVGSGPGRGMAVAVAMAVAIAIALAIGMGMGMGMPPGV